MKFCDKNDVDVVFKKRIVFLSQSFPSLRFARILRERDHNVLIITSNPSIAYAAKLEKFIVVEKAKNYLQNKGNVSVSTIDGVRVSGTHGWWLLRASNTQAALVARCEADTPMNLDLIKKELKDLLENIGILETNF